MHFGPACSDAIDTLEASRLDSEQLGQSGPTDNIPTFALLESGWVVFNSVKKQLTAQFGKLCLHWKKPFTNIYQKSAEQGQKWGWAGMSRSHSLEVS